MLTNLAILTCIYLVVLSGAHLIVHLAGHMTLGLAAWWCATAYACGFAIKSGLPTWVGVLLGASVGASVGILNCLLTLRLSKLSYTLASLAVQQLMLALLASSALLGGRLGMTGIERLNSRCLSVLAVLTLAAFPILLALFKRTRLSRSLHALREDRLASETLGVNPFQVWLKIYVIAGLLIGLAGSLYALHMGTVMYASFSIHVSVLLLLAVIVGSPFGSLGPLAGSAFLVLIPELLLLLPLGVKQPEFLRNMMFAASAIVILLNKHWKAHNKRRSFGSSAAGRVFASS